MSKLPDKIEEAEDLALAGKLDELGLPAVLQIESADGSIARTIVSCTQNKNQQILTMDSMQSTTTKDVAAGTSYLCLS